MKIYLKRKIKSERMMRQPQQQKVVVGSSILLASSSSLLMLFYCCCLLLQQCDAAAAASAPPFVSMMSSNNNNNNRRTRIIIDPHHLSDDEMMMMTNDNNSKTFSSSLLSSDEDGGSSTTSTATVYNLKATTISSSISNCGKGVLKHLRAGGLSSSPSSSPLLSTIFTIVAQTLNVATAAIVASGYLGCWIAPFIIQQLHHHQHQQLILSGSDILHQVKTWKWTICATITHILFNNNNNNILQMKNTNSLVFLLSLWIYSYMVNTTLGGYIGCTHVILGVISSVMGSSLIINRVSNFMNVRLPPLDDNDNGGSDDDDNDSSMLLKKSSLSREEEKSSRGSSSSSVSVREDVLVRFMSSLSIFTSFPQDCLSLYLGSSALITWVSSLDLNSSSSSSSSSSQLGMMVWKVVGEKWLPWWMDGLVGNHDMIGKDGATTTMMVIETKSVSMRLFALHVIIMLIKGTTALLLQL